jgi:hypothetical protein
MADPMTCLILDLKKNNLNLRYNFSDSKHTWHGG